MAYPQPHKPKKEREDEEKPGGERGAPRGDSEGKSHDPKDQNLPQKARVGGTKDRGGPPVGQDAALEQGQQQVGGEGG